MKNISFFLLMSFVVLATACEKDSCEQTWTQMASVPVTLNRALVQDSIGLEEPIDLCVGGGIYAYGDYIFMNRLNEGFHILDNSNPSNPINVKFLRIPGATQMAFVEGLMVANSYADLVTLEFTGLESVRMVASTPNFLLDEASLPVDSDQLVIGYELQEVEFQESCDGSVRGGWGGCTSCDVRFANVDGAGSAGPPTVNTAGSITRMAFSGNRLYVIGTSRLTTYSIHEGTLSLLSNVSQGWGMETILVQEDFLYIGAQGGMFTFSLANRDEPQFVSLFRHFTGCDPVSVEGDIAVVTVRDGFSCGQESSNLMYVLNMEDKTSPVELTRVDMTNPRGVALYEGWIYVCDGEAGLRVFDLAGGPVQELAQRERQVYDADAMTDVAVLPYSSGTVLLSVGDDHLSQFDLQDDHLISLVSRLSAQNCIQP